jgi:hypothetical protein
MQKMTLGKTGLQVTKLGLGSVQLAKISTEEAVRVVHTGLDLGITFIETARSYWDAEEKIGKAIKGRRDKIVLATKAQTKDASQTIEKIEESLKVLGIDYIDLYQYHSCDTRQSYEDITKPGGVLEGMLKAKEQGKIRTIGFSSHQIELALEMMDADIFASVQLPISFMNVENHEKGLFEKAEQKDVGLIAMKPFGGGRLGNARLCMGYVLSIKNVVAAVGVETPEQVKELVQLTENPPALEDTDRAEMERIRNEVGTRFCRACNYCQPCPENIQINQVLCLPIFAKQFSTDKLMTKERIETVRHAGDCTECRQCEQRCPFNLEIVEGLKNCRALMERLIAEHGIQ